jgi:hypothetical protein
VVLEIVVAAELRGLVAVVIVVLSVVKLDISFIFNFFVRRRVLVLIVLVGKLKIGISVVVVKTL